MYYSKQQIASKVSKISQSKLSYDLKLQELQKLIKNNKQYQVVNLRQYFTSIIQELEEIFRENDNKLRMLEYQCQKLTKEGVELNSQKIRIQSLKDYFKEFKERTKRQKNKGQEVISGLERWDITRNNSGGGNQDEHESLLQSRQVAQQTKQVARNVFQVLSNQGSRLENTRQKMGNVIKNINFSGNIAQLLKKRTHEDNRLITMLSIGLVLWIMVCLFVIKPWFRSTQ